MKQKITLLLSLLILINGVFAQNNNKRSLFGIHINSLDATSAAAWKNHENTFVGLAKLDRGISLSYWKLICSKVDFSVKGTILLHDYDVIDRGATNALNKKAGIELEPSLNIKSLKDEAVFNPFISLGLGIGNYSNELGAYVPIGVGVQSNLGNITYLFLQTQYRQSLTKDKMNSSFLYSFGITERIEKEKPKPVVLPAPPVVLDRDSDGIADGDDKCPDVAGIAKYLGCPIPDTDNDGVNDEEDKCPTVKGLARLEGCPIPDTDNDGVNDEEDKCPNVAGPASNMGCPVIEQKIIEKINKDAGKIYFASSSAKLLSKSYPALNEIVAVLNNDTTLKLDVAGHTDITGNAAKNKTLSQNRANAILKYISSKGISADRATATGFGQEKPIATNKTAAGRAKNRRIEMVLRNY